MLRHWTQADQEQTSPAAAAAQWLKIVPFLRAAAMDEKSNVPDPLRLPPPREQNGSLPFLHRTKWSQTRLSLLTSRTLWMIQMSNLKLLQMRWRQWHQAMCLWSKVLKAALDLAAPLNNASHQLKAGFQSMELSNIYSMFTSAQGNTHLPPS